MSIKKLTIFSISTILLSFNLPSYGNIDKYKINKNVYKVNKEEISKNKLLNLKNKFINKDISNIKSYPIINPNLLNIKGPKISLVLDKMPAKNAFEYLAQLGNFGYVWVQSNPTNKDKKNATGPDAERPITLSMKDVSFKRAFNALIVASGLQAKIYNNVIYVGPNVRNTVFTYRESSIVQLNQITASSAADYLANLGASVTKTFVVSTSVTEGASQSQSIQGGSSTSTTTSQSETKVEVYGADIGPLVGLIATTDERLQTITLVGEISLIKLAKSYLRNLDKRQKQVALNVRVLDVNLSDKDSFSQSWLIPFNLGSPVLLTESPNLKAIVGNPVNNNKFRTELAASIEKGSTKVLASPTLILNEDAGSAGDGSSIGRAFANEGFVEVGDKVAVGASFAEGQGCNFSYDLVGIKLGAKILGIDENRFVTFSMTPVVTGISGTQEIANCGIVNLLNTRRLDTGAVRIKNGETLVLTGVIQDSDVEKIIKYPILGDIPILGSIFRTKSNEKGKRELIVLVTPKIINDTGSNLKNYNLELKNQDSLDLLQKVEN